MNHTDPALRRLIEQVCTAHAEKCPMDIQGGNTKRFYGGAPRGQALRMDALSGISSYEPTELVVTVRAGTLLTDLEETLAAQGQCLAFEPPRFAGGGTVGGMVAAGFSGPSRASVGAVRDYVLGATMLNGKGEVLTFGGQVMKNVAGYDVSRLLAGSLGVLGLVCEVSLKVLPFPAASATLLYEANEAHALKMLSAWASQALPLNASTWHRGRLTVRLAGAHAAVRAASSQMGGTVLSPELATLWWNSVRDHGQPFFALSDADLARGEALWRLSLPATAVPLGLPGELFIEWGGAQRWWRGVLAPLQMRAAAMQAGGHATLFRGADKSAGVMTPLSPALARIHRTLKAAFDPAAILNPGRLYADL